MEWNYLRGDKLNPYSYAEKLQEIMIQKAVKSHFDKEKESTYKKYKNQTNHTLFY